MTKFKPRTRCLRGLAEAANKSERYSLFTELMLKGYDDDYEPRYEPEPTEHPPGSVGKIEVMRDRLMRGEDLTHEDDCQTSASIELQDLARIHVVAIYKNRKRMW